MSRRTLLALAAVSATACGAVLVGAGVSAAAEDGAAAIVLDTPVDFVRHGAELQVSGTVFDSEDRRSVRTPVALATWNSNLEEHVWGKTVITDANGRFKTSIKATSSLGESVLVTPVLGGEEGAQLLEARIPSVPLQYPVALTVAREGTEQVRLTVKSLDCEGSRVVVEAAVGRQPFAPLGELSECSAGVLSGSLPRPTSAGALQFRVHRLPDADGGTVRSTSPVVTLR